MCAYTGYGLGNAAKNLGLVLLVYAGFFTDLSASEQPRHMDCSDTTAAMLVANCL